MIVVDPGLRGSGLALFDPHSKTLERAEWIPNPVKQGDDADAIAAMVKAVNDASGYTEADNVTVVAERMHTYAAKQFAAKALITLSLITGGLRPTHLYTFQQWAGGLSEEQIWTRIRSRLTPHELSRIGKMGPHKDALAAVGIGLHHLGRLAPRRVYARE